MNRAEMRRKAREQEKCRLPLNFKMQLGIQRKSKSLKCHQMQR